MKLTAEEWKIIDDSFFLNQDKDNYVGAALRDLFAMGCYLHSKGQTEAGEKAIKTALRATPFVNDQFKTNLFTKVLEYLPGNEAEYLRNIRPHTELLGLLETE
ncbi:MAG TPA: hypothetical protein DER40_02345 [Geobacter sp.]|nr:MAG: hypothetical protein A2X85_06880 [Geobacteraceae bacterium GWF2_54_21]HBA71677.1 hypothetical protein [Geobacter sp.]HCE66391.1 hypothetical protein [Geobacter sp.]